MRTGPAFTNPTPVPSIVATAGSATVPVDGASFSHDIGGAGLPSELAGGGSSVVAQCTLDVIPRAVSTTGIADRLPTPWRREGGLPLIPGARMNVALGEDGVTHPVLTFGAVNADQGTADADMSITVEGDLDELDRTISWAYLAALMPPAQDAHVDFRGEMRRVALSHWYVVDRLLRAGNRGTHPGWQGTAGVSAPLVDSLWPEVGEVVQAFRSTTEQTQYPIFAAGLDTKLLSAGFARYTPLGSLTPAATGGVSVSLRVGANHAGTTDVAVRWPSQQQLVVRVTDSRQVSVWGSADTDTRVVRTMAAGEDRVHVRATTAGAVVITTGDGTTSASTAGNIAPVTGWATVGADYVTINAADGSRVGGLAVTTTNTAAHVTGWSQLGRLHTAPSTISASLSDMPRQHKRTALEVLSEVCAAACLTLWRGADRVINVAAPDALRARASVGTINASVMEALNWSRQLDVVRHQVILRHQVPEVTTGGVQPSVTLWQSSGETLPRGHLRRDIASIPADEDWIVCTELHKIGQPIASTYWGNPDAGMGTIVGGWVPAPGTTGTWSHHATDELTVGFNTFDPRVGLYVITSATVTANMAPGEMVILDTAPMDSPTGLPSRFRDQATPILRGWRKVKWVDAETLSTRTGPSDAPDLVHDAGPWVQFGAQALADWIATVACPLPGEHGLIDITVPIRPDWRLEVGDVIRIVDPTITLLDLTCLITRISASVGPGAMGMDLSLQVLTGATTLTTYAEVDAHHAPRTYAQVDAVVDPATYAQVDSFPKR